MSQRVLICCDGARPKDVGLKAGKCVRQEIRRTGSGANLTVKSIGSQILENLDDVCSDLVDVASFVYAADRLVSRGSPKDLGHKWRRSFLLVMPVRCPERWKSQPVLDKLQDTLAFLSDDHYEFHFCKRSTDTGVQSVLPFQSPDIRSADVISLFSGGMDSLAGAVHDIAANGYHPLLVSHWPIYRTKSRQNRLAKLMRERFPDQRLPHVQALVQMRGVNHPEPTQRSRSFLYLCLASVLAKQLSLSRIRMYENGVVALNLPIWRQCVGGMDTRTAHPKFLKDFECFVHDLLQADISVENPFFFKTRTEVAELLNELGHADLIEASISCSRIYWMSEAMPHCGACSQCIDRRFAMEAAGLTRFDPPGSYENDIFYESLAQIEARKGWHTCKARAMAVGYVRSVVEIGKMPIGQFLQEYPEVWDAVPYLGLPEEQALENIYDLQCRHSRTMKVVMTRLVAGSASALSEGKLSRDSLVGIIAAQEHVIPPIQNYAERVASILQAALPVTFQSHAPKDEKEVQDAAQAALRAAGEDLDREFPQLSFAAVVGVKPDFSEKNQRLFIELKYPRPKSRSVNAIASEMTRKLLQYQQNGASVLFVVYDHHKMIGNRSGFCAEFEQYEDVFIRVIV